MRILHFASQWKRLLAAKKICCERSGEQRVVRNCGNSALGFQVDHLFHCFSCKDHCFTKDFQLTNPVWTVIFTVVDFQGVGIVQFMYLRGLYYPSIPWKSKSTICFTGLSEKTIDFLHGFISLTIPGDYTFNVRFLDFQGNSLDYHKLR